jgi:hypothetical protein
MSGGLPPGIYTSRVEIVATKRPRSLRKRCVSVKKNNNLAKMVLSAFGRNLPKSAKA